MSNWVCKLQKFATQRRFNLTDITKVSSFETLEMRHKQQSALASAIFAQEEL